MRRYLGFLFSPLALTACAGREADLAVLAQTGDHDKSCQQLAGEVHTWRPPRATKLTVIMDAMPPICFWARWAPYCGGRRGWPWMSKTLTRRPTA